MQNTYTDRENNVQRVSESTGAKFSCVTFHNLHIYPASDNIPDIRYRCTLMDHYDSMHYPDLNFEKNRPIMAKQK